jgi:Protein prenyltransferase, alpha subunit
MDNIAHGYNDDGDDDDDDHKEEDAVYSSFIMDGSWSVMDNGFTLQHENLPRMGAQMAIEEKEEEEISTKRGSSEKRQIYVPKNHKMANKIQQSLIAEWNFTTEKIEQNFSNGSAFHYRSKLLPLLIALEKDKLGNGEDEEGNDGEKDGCPSFVKIQVFQKELEIIRNAIFTEPDDQTSWWYFRFILSWANPAHDETNDGISMEEFQTILYDEWNAIQELVQDEDWKCKWGLLGLHMIASEFCHLSEKGLSVLLLLQEQDWKELEKTYLMRLMELDPDRRCRYQSMYK